MREVVAAPVTPTIPVGVGAGAPAYGIPYSSGAIGGGGVALGRPPMSNGAANWAIGLGLFSLVLTSSVFFLHGGTSLVLSTSGIVAIINGARALQRRSAGLADAIVRPIIGIVAGSLGTLIMVLSFIGYGIAGSAYNSSYNSTPQNLYPQQQQQQPGTVSVPSTPKPIPTATPDPNGESVQKPAALPSKVAGYRSVVVKTLPRESVGCTGISGPLANDYAISIPRTADRIAQDATAAEVQLIANEYTHGSPQPTTVGWPKRLMIDKDTGLIFSPECQGLGRLPADTKLIYKTAPDKHNVSIEVYNKKLHTGTIFLSYNNAIYPQ